jgi:hypothetical protein
VAGRLLGADAGLEGEHDRGDREEFEGEHRGPRLAERAEFDVDDAGEHVVLHDGRRPEVREGVQRDQQRPGQHARGDLRQDDAPERGAVAVVQRPGGLQLGRVEGEKRRAGREEDVGVDEERQDECGAGESADGRDGDAERREEVGEFAPRAERREVRERADVAGHDQREGGGDGPQPAQREVRLDGEHRERDPDGDGAGGDDRDEDEAVCEHPDGGGRGRQGDGVGGPDLGGPRDEPEDGREDGDGDGDRGGREQAARDGRRVGAALRAGDRRRGGGVLVSAHQRTPVSRSNSRVGWTSDSSVRSSVGGSSSSMGGRPPTGGTPGTVG